MTQFERIRKIIKKYQEKMDGHYADYKRKEAVARKTFSEIGFKEKFMLGTWVDMASAARTAADDAVRDIDQIFDQIEQDYNDWVMRPLNANALQVLNCISNFNINLSLKELQNIEKNVSDNYWGNRIFAGLCEKNGYSVTIPQLDKYIDALQAARNNSHFAVEAYAGKGSAGYPGKDLIREWKINGVNMGNYKNYHLYMAESFLKEGGKIDRLEKLWGLARAPMTYILTESEANKVKKSLEQIVNRDGEVDEEKAKKLTEKEPDIVSKLKSMPDGSLEHMDSVKKYFHLNDDDKKDEGQASAISPAVGNAAKYSAGRGQVDMELLKNFQ